MKGETLTVDGVTRTLLEWSRLTGKKVSTLRGRIRRGLKGALVLAERKFNTSVEYTWKGETHTLGEWSKITGIEYKTLCYRHEHQVPIHLMFHKVDKRPPSQITYQGETRTGAGWARHLKLTSGTFWRRYHQWGIKRTVETARPKKVYYALYTGRSRYAKLLAVVRGNDGYLSWQQIIKLARPSLDVQCLVIRKVTRKQWQEYHELQEDSRRGQKVARHGTRPGSK